MSKIIKEQLKVQSLKVYDSGLVIHNFGNLSAKSNDRVYIKASGASLKSLTNKDLVCIELNSLSYN